MTEIGQFECNEQPFLRSHLSGLFDFCDEEPLAQSARTATQGRQGLRLSWA